MARTVTLNGVSMSVPEPNDNGYGTALTSYLVALATAFPQLGGAWALTSELDFGASFGVKALYLKSETTNPASSGVVRLAKSDSIAFRNAANSGDVALAKDAGDALTFAGNNVTGNPMMDAVTGAGQSIPNSTTTIVVFGTVNRDSDNAYNSLTGRYTVPAGKGGDYEIEGSMAYGGTVTGTPSIAIYKNALQLRLSVASAPVAAQTLVVGAILNLAAGDIIDIRAQQASGGAVALGGTTASNFFSLKRVPT